MENINVTELNIILSVFIVFYVMFLIGLYRYKSKHSCTKQEYYTNDGSSSNGSSNSGSSSSSETCESRLTSCESARSMYAYGSGLLCCVCCSFMMVLCLIIMFMAYKLSQQ